MTRWIMAILLLAALLQGCGRYGPPVRVGAAVSSGTAPHAPSCEDPAHDHADPPQPDDSKP